LVNPLFLNAVQGVAVMYGLSPANTVYLFAFLFSVFFGIIAGVRSGRPLVGVGTFIGVLFLFAVLDAFPLWILALPLVVMLVLYTYQPHGGDI